VVIAGHKFYRPSQAGTRKLACEGFLLYIPRVSCAFTADDALKLLADGQSPHAMRYVFHVSEATVTARLRELFERYGVDDHIKVAIKAIVVGDVKISERLIQKWERLPYA
jgi:hypothetical protein